MSIPFYGLKIYNEDKLVRDFKPCMNEEGTIGVYDFVSNKFFKLNGAENYKVKEKEVPDNCKLCLADNKKAKLNPNCWRCVAERLFNARQVTEMKVGKVYLYQMYHESFEEFDTAEEAEQFRNYADKNIPYWDYDPVSVIDLNDYEQVIICKHRGWIKDNG